MLLKFEKETLWRFAGRGECVRSRGELRLKRNVGRRPAEDGGREGALNRGREREGVVPCGAACWSITLAMDGFRGGRKGGRKM